MATDLKVSQKLSDEEVAAREWAIYALAVLKIDKDATYSTLEISTFLLAGNETTA